MAKPSPFLQSPFQALIDQQSEPVLPPAFDPVNEVELPEIEAAPVEAPQPVAPVPKVKKAKYASLIPPQELREVFAVSSSHFGVPENVLMAIAQQESSYDPQAMNAESGAGGIVQYMDATAKSLGINRHDPNEAIPAAAMQIKERLDKGMSLEDAVMEHFAGPDRKKWGPKTAAYGKQVLEKAEAIGRELYGDLPDEAPQQAAPVDQTPLPNFGVTPEALKRIQAQWNAATPDERVQMEALRGPRGYIARELNKRHPAKQTAPNPLGLEVDPIAQVNEAYKNPTLDSIDPRAEARARNLVNQGMEGGTANKVARAAALAGMAPGTEPGIGQRIENSSFDFETRRKFNEDPFFSNPAVRGAVKGYEGYKRGILGLNQMAAEVLGAENVAGSLAEANAESREQEAAMGQASSYGQRMFEGAASSIAQQIPALIGGAVTGSEALVLGTMFAQTLGNEYSEGRARGQNEEQALGRAALYGTFEVVGEKLGLGDTLKGLRGAVDGATTKDVATTMARALLKEIPGEQLTTLGQFGVDQLEGGYGLNTEAGLAEYLQQAADTAVQTVLQGGMMAGGASAVAQAGQMAGNRPQQMPQERIEPSMQPEAQDLQPAAPSMQPAPPAGPLESAVRAAAPQEESDAWTSQVMGDDGQMYTIDSATGVVAPAEPQTPAGPLESAVQAAAVLHATDPAPAPAMPEPEPQAPDYASMALPDLQARLKEIASAAKADINERKRLMPERKAVEQEINARLKAAKEESKPAEEPLTSGPFEDIKQANRMMLRHVDKTGVPHEVVEDGGKFRIKPLEASDGLDTAGASGGTDGLGRSSGDAAVVGLPDGAGHPGAGTVPVGEHAGTAGERGSDAASNRAAANGPADNEQALAEAPRKNPYQPYQFARQELAEAFMDKKAVDRNQFEAVQIGPNGWKVMPRAAQEPVSTAPEVTADVSQRQEVPEEAQVAAGAQGAQQAGAGDRTEGTDAAAGTAAAQAAPAVSRRYHIVAINEKTGTKEYMTRTSEPLTHAQAVTMKSKISDYPGRRVQLEQVASPAPVADKPKRKVNASVARRQEANARQEEAVRKAQEALDKRKAAHGRNSIDELMAMEEDAGEGFKKNDRAISIIQRAASGFLPTEKAKLTRAINKHTKIERDGTRLVDPRLYEEVANQFAGAGYLLHDAIDSAEQPQPMAAEQPSAPIQDVKSKANSKQNLAKDLAKDVDLTDAEFEHNGMRIYPIRINIGGEPVSRWAVETPDNRERRTKGERTVGGDSIHETVEQAKKAAEFERKQAQQAAEQEARAAEEKVAADRAKSKRKADTAGGFLEGKAPNVQELARKALDKQYRFDGKVMTVRERIDALFASGELEVSTFEEPKIKPLSRSAFNRASGAEQAAHERKMKEAGTKTTYLVSDSELGKIAYDYAQFLLSKKSASKPAAEEAKTEDLEAEEVRMSAAVMPIEQEAAPALDPFVKSLADAGVIRLHDSVDTLPDGAGSMAQDIQAVTARDGTIHIIASSLDENARGIILHEAFHSGGKSLIGSRAWRDLMQRLNALYNQGKNTGGTANAFWKQAERRVKVAQLKGAVAPGMEAEEFGAYAIEEYAQAPLTVKKWVDDLIGAIKAWLLRRFGAQLGQITPAQLSALAKMALLDVQTSRSDSAFSVDRRAQERATEERRKRTIEVDGVRRPIYDANGKLVAQDFNGQMRFWKWFGDSKIVNEHGEPRPMFHGTPNEISAFKPGRHGLIFVAPNRTFAEKYAGAEWTVEVEGGSPNVLPVYVHAENVFDGDNAAHVESVLAELHKDGKNADIEADLFAGKYWELIEEDEIIQAIREAGFDGLYINEEGETNVAVFGPNQLKSAIGNNGQFDASNPDIRYSVAGSPPIPMQDEAEQVDTRSLTPEEQGILRKMQANVQDSQNRIKQVQERIRKAFGVEDLGGADHYLAETNRPGRIAARKEDARDRLIEPMVKRLAKAGYTPAQLSELLHAQHAEERNVSVGGKNPPGSDFFKAVTNHDIVGASGMSTNKAKEILKRYEGEGDLLRLADEARNIARSTLDLKLEYGLITQIQYDSLAISYENYVPLKGDGEYGPRIRQATGHGEREEHILENLSRDYEQAIVVGEKNLARQSLLRMVLSFADDKLWTARVPPRGRYVAGTVFNITHKGTGDIEAAYTEQSQVTAWLEAKGASAAQYEVNTSGGEQVVEFTKPLQDNEVMVYVKGDPVRIQIYDETLARQLRPLKGEQMNVVLEFMRKHNRWLSMVFTGYNPAFIVKNATRDAITGSINMTGNHGAATAVKAWARYPMAWATMLQWAATKKVPDTDMGRMLAEYRAQGGKVGASYMSDLEEQGKSLQRMFDDAKGVKGYATEGRVLKASAVAARKTIMGLAHAVEVLNQAFENALRLALFAQLRAEGQKPGKAAAAAKAVTVNFDRKGALTNQMGAFYLFINPAIQGTANATMTMVKGEHKYQAWALTGMMAGAGFAMAAMGMDDDKDRWLGEKWDTRTKNLRMRVGETTINIPMSQEFAPFYALGVAMGEVSRGESTMRATTNILSSFLDAYYPMQGAVQPGSDNPAMDLLLAHIPTIGKMPAQVAANRNSFGSKVIPETENTRNRPDNLKMNRATKGSVYDAAAQALATGKPYENDLSKVSPETLKLVWGTYTGGLGRFVADSVGAGHLASQANLDMDAGDVPILKDFVKPDSVNPIRSRFYDLSNEARKTIDEFAAAKKALDRQAMQEIAARPNAKTHLGLAKMVKSVNEVQALYADRAVAINADKTLNAADKRAQLKALEAEQEAIYRKAIEAFKQ